MKSEAQLLREIAQQPSLAAQAALVEELDTLRSQRAAALQDERDVGWADAVITETLSPVLAYSHHTAATDWLEDVAAPPVDEIATQAVLAEAALWLNRRTAAVKADPEEFAEQLRGYARRVASAYGEAAPAMERAFTDYVAFLLRREGASGLDQIQQLIDPNNNPKSTQMPTDTFDTFQDPIAPENQGIEEQQASTNAPLLQEILQEGNGTGQAEVPGGHSTGPANSGAPNPNQGLMGRESSLREPWDGPSVAIGYTMNLDDFREAEATRQATAAARPPQAPPDPITARRRVVGEVTREAASGLPQIDQVIDPNNQYAPTPYPEQVAFPLEGEFAEEHSTQEVPGYPVGGPRGNKTMSGLHTQADMFGSGDTQGNGGGEIGSVPPYNTPNTIPQRGTSFEQGRAAGAADAQAGARPTYADAGANGEPFQKGYSQGFSDVKRGGGHPDVPFSMDRNVTSNDSGSLDASQGTPQATSKKVASRRFVSAKTAAHPDYQRGFQTAASYDGSRIPPMGTPEFEAGLYAGIRGNVAHQATWVEHHKQAGSGNSPYARRIAIHQAYTEHLRRQADITDSEPSVQFGTGVPVGQSYEPAGPGYYEDTTTGNNEGRDGTPHAQDPNRRQAATSIDLDTLSPAGNPDSGGQTPLNGPGTAPPGSLDGQPPAAPGGPAPYNGAPPYGKPVAPDPGLTGPSLTQQRLTPQQAAFRKQVQAGLLHVNRT